MRVYHAQRHVIIIHSCQLIWHIYCSLKLNEIVEAFLIKQQKKEYQEPSQKHNIFGLPENSAR